MLTIKMEVEDLAELIDDIRDNSRMHEVRRDLKQEMINLQEEHKVYKENQKNDKEKIKKLQIILKEIEKYVDDSGIPYDKTQNLPYKVHQIIYVHNAMKNKINTVEYQGKQLAKYEGCIQDAMKHLELICGSDHADKALAILRKRVEDDKFTILAIQEKRVHDAIEAIKKHDPMKALHILEGATFHCLKEFMVDVFKKHYQSISQRGNLAHLERIIGERLNA